MTRSRLYRQLKRIQPLFLSVVLCMTSYSQGPTTAVQSDKTESYIRGGNAQRTRVFDMEAVGQPSSLMWRTSRLYTAVKTYHSTVHSQLGSGLGGSIGFGSFDSGHGHSEMLLVADTIFFTVYINDGYIYAQDAKTGKDRWRFQLKTKAVSSVASDGSRVYFTAADGSIYALDIATGREIWKKTQKSQVFGYTLNSPIVVGKVVYVTSVEHPLDGGRHPDGRVFALDADTGREIWVYKLDAYLTSPVVYEDSIYVVDGIGVARALDRATGTERWKSKGSGKGVSLPLIETALLITESREKGFRAIDARTGTEVWKSTKLPKAATMLAGFNGTLYYGAEGKNLHAVEAATGLPRWEFKTDGQCASPIVNRKIIYASCGDSLLAVDASTGTQIWGMNKLIAPLTPPLLGNRVLYFIDGAAQLYALK